MPYTEVKTYQQNFIVDESQISNTFYFRPLAKKKPTNKWKIACSSITIASITTTEYEGHCVWIANCPLLTGYGYTDNDGVANNNILLGSETYSIRVDALSNTVTTFNDLKLTGTTFIVDDIKRDPFTILNSYTSDPFGLTEPILAKLFVTFDITEIERD